MRLSSLDVLAAAAAAAAAAVKQTGFYYAGVSANATLIGNIFFNGGRGGEGRGWGGGDF